MRWLFRVPRTRDEGEAQVGFELFVGIVAFAGAILLSGCATVSTYGAAAIEQRRIMNDQQARATMAATCDIALGAYFRELSEAERTYAGLVCGGERIPLEDTRNPL